MIQLSWPLWSGLIGGVSKARHHKSGSESHYQYFVIELVIHDLQKRK